MAAVRNRRQQELTAVSVFTSSTLTNNEAEVVLSSFLDEVTDKNNSARNQLERVQRDLRGLPPALRNSTTGEVEEGIPTYQDPQDEPMEVEEVVVEEQGEEEENTDKLSKEDRKRLKKERRKKEKKQKAQKSDKDEQD